jgi:hypothetical protein
MYLTQALPSVEPSTRSGVNIRCSMMAFLFGWLDFLIKFFWALLAISRAYKNYCYISFYKFSGVPNLFLYELTTVGVSYRRLVNLYLRVWPEWWARKTRKFILVQAECPYVQFELLVFLHWFVVGVTNGREREWAPKYLVAKCCVGEWKLF